MRLRDLAELVRAPAALTVPGDTLAGAAAAGWPHGRRTFALPLASACFYWSGMALNDWADRELDATERPERPIPSGRVTPGQALGVAAGLSATGLVVTAAAAGRSGLAVAVPLVGAVWAYDVLAKPTPAGPVVMASTRALDVLLGAAGSTRQALYPAAAVATHTVGVTVLSRGEVHGAARLAAPAALAGTVLAATAAAVPRRGTPVPASVAAAGLALTYAGTVGRAQLDAVRDGRAVTVRRATGSGVRGVLPLQSALAARAAAPVVAAATMLAGPLAKLASRVVSPT